MTHGRGDHRSFVIRTGTKRDLIRKQTVKINKIVGTDVLDGPNISTGIFSI